MAIKYFQDIDIDFGKASKEYINEEIDTIQKLRSDNNYLYKLSMEKIVNWINFYINNQESVNGQSINNIYSIVGERGTGKSSFISTLQKIIDSQGYLENKNARNRSNVYVLPKIDPTIFNSRVRMIEFFVATLKSEVDKEHKKLHFGYTKTDDDFMALEKFNKLIREIVTILKDMRVKESIVAEKKSAVEVLQTIQDQNNFREKISDLMITFLILVNKNQKEDYTHIALLVDDLDLVPNKHVFETLQDMFQFLQYQKELIVFTAYREEQLNNSVIDVLISENKQLLDEKIIGMEELRKQAVSFIEKGLSRNQRVYLLISHKTLVYDILKPFINLKEGEEIECFSENQTLNDFIQQEMMLQTRLQINPIDASEQTNFTFPKTLRTSLEYLELLHDMESYQKSVNEESALVVSINKLRKNIKTYKYFSISKFRDYLPAKEFSIIDEWINREYHSRNSYICRKLIEEADYLKLRIPEPSEMVKLVDTIVQKEIYNISLGDVFTCIEVYKSIFNNNEQKNYFIYAIKIMYSIEMLLTLTKSIETSSKRERENYLSMARGKIMPDMFWYNKDLISGKTTFSLEFKEIETTDALLKENERNDLQYTVEEKQAVMNNLFYSDIAVEGEVRKSGNRNLDFNQAGFSYKYRNFYSKENFQDRNQYYGDPYSCLTDEKYLLSISFNNEEHPYLFYSMFDLDFFVRKNYSRSSEDNLFTYVINKIDDIFKNNLTTYEEQKMRKKMVIPLFSSNDNIDSTKFVSLFDKNFRSFLERKNSQKEYLLKAQFSDYINRFNNSDEELVASDHKTFLRNYKNQYKDWPRNKRLDIQRLDELCKKGNSKQITVNDKIMIKTLIQEIKNK